MDDSLDIKQELVKIIGSNKTRIESECLTLGGQLQNARVYADQEWVIKYYSNSSFVLSPPEASYDFVYSIEEDVIFPSLNGDVLEWDEMLYAGLLVIEESLSDLVLDLTGKIYTRAGMLERIVDERSVKAKNAKYTIKWSDNLYGEHILINERGKRYHITIHDFDRQIGYIDNIDWKTNKLGTTKHIIYLCNELATKPGKKRSLKKKFPFIDIYLNPESNYSFSWFYPDQLTGRPKEIIELCFGSASSLTDDEMDKMQLLLSEIESDDRFKIRPEVYDKMERIADLQMLEIIGATHEPDFSAIKADLYSYQKEGVLFALFKKAAIIADEMGLGKTLQAISIAIMKKDVFDFRKCVIICPASLKHQWKSEIEKFSDEQAIIIEGPPSERAKQYNSDEQYFFIVNYEAVLRDSLVMNKAGFDFIILDEAQRIKNFETKTASSIQRLKKQHGLVLTGTPIENKLIDLYSIMLFLDIHFLTPLWEFSYQHCVFDHSSKNKITGYYNLNNLNLRLQDILIRREKRQVINELPNIVQRDIPVHMSREQHEYHTSYAKGVAQILRKKFKTPFDWQRLMLLLNSMRMVADATYLIDKETKISPKLEELEHILLEKLDIRNKKRKIIIFSEWINMLKLIEERLLNIGIGYTLLTGKVPVKKRHKLIEEFESNDECQIFLSTESGGTGLNLQMADTVINFELPWNPAKKNQRIGRIDRIGQKHEKLAVFNLISLKSIEMKIASGLELKQNLFEGVLNKDNATDTIDFTDKGRAQFIKELEEYFDNLDHEKIYDDVAEELVEDKPDLADMIDEEVLDGEVVPDALEDKVIEPESQVPVEEELYNEPSTSGAEPPGPTDSDGTTRDHDVPPTDPPTEQIEEVFTKGLEFLSGIYKMSTGKDLMPGEGGAVKVDKESGEVTITFKIK